MAAAFARATDSYARIGLDLGPSFVTREILGQDMAEGALLARYRFRGLRKRREEQLLEELQILTSADDVEMLSAGIERGRTTATATNFARDLVYTPANYLTASALAAIASSLPADLGLTVETFDRKKLQELGCGGILGVNAGSAEEPCVIRLRYSPAEPDGTPLVPTGTLAIVGKGIMYDSGDISLKPSDASRLSMKMDMAGAAAVIAAMTALRALGCTAAVTAYLMCTDNMPSGSATKLGDVLTIRDGTTVEVKNTDAEGRLVLADGLALAQEEKPGCNCGHCHLDGIRPRGLGASHGCRTGQ